MGLSQYPSYADSSCCSFWALIHGVAFWELDLHHITDGGFREK